jgi:diaminopimelate decarboxylase
MRMLAIKEYLKERKIGRPFPPDMIKMLLNRFGSVFTEWMDSRAKPLSEAELCQYVESILSKKGFLLESARRFGTPQYFFDEPSLVRQIDRFRRTFSKYQDHCRIFYAMKSNSFAGICKRVVAEGIGLDVSSGLELSSALATGCDKIIFSGPGKTDEEISLAIQNRNRVTLLMDSYGEFQRVRAILKRDAPGKPAIKAGIRVRSRYHGDWNKFGISLDDLIFLLNKIQSTDCIEASGIQFHTSWNLNPGRQIRMINEIGTYLRRHIMAKGIEKLKFLDIGGGFWPEQGEWLNTENTYMGRLIKDIFPSVRLRRKHFRRGAKRLDYFAREIFDAILRQGRPLTDLEVWTEPGRWISTPTMHILLQVVDVKGPRTIITDGGTNLLGWERPLAEYIPVINLSRPSLIENDTTVFGSLCTPYDIWGKAVFGDQVQTGDILIIPDQGAYTYSLRQSFIKPRAGVITYDGESLEESEKADILADTRTI